MRRKVHFSSAQADLYDALLSISNSLHWENPFWHTNTLVRGLVGCTEKTLIKARNALKQKGLIDFVSGTKNEATVYTLLHLKDYCKNYSEKGSEKGSDKYSDMDSEKVFESIDLIKTKEERVKKKEESVYNTHAQLEDLQEKFKQLSQEHQALLQERRKKPPPRVPPAPSSKNPQLRIESTFTVPSIQEVAAFYTECTGVNGQTSYTWAKRFVAKNAATGWVMGKNRVPMADWKGAVQVWVAQEVSPDRAVEPTQEELEEKRKAQPADQVLRKEYHNLLQFAPCFTDEEREKGYAYSKKPDVTQGRLEAELDRCRKIVQTYYAEIDHITKMQPP